MVDLVAVNIVQGPIETAELLQFVDASHTDDFLEVLADP